ncbi:7,8-dihydro-8-oxoguanine triphosphatase [Mycena venus]|uniref:7,8-dihydro-8-oxoguanine triphosphatase n=1 Tax=Mycena venus TaxID=2733690 RepID=A0A8H6WQV5_9AGAR|nr:7,8-dihydro-8-oxoguanine triphosphatase [Mycena venus]
MPPPGLAGNLKEFEAGGSGDWFPSAEIRYYTNVFVVQDDKILLGYKKRGLGIHKSESSHYSPLAATRLIVSPRYNGFGGKVEPNESTLDAALRELKEEAGITAPLTHAGTLLFVVPGEKWAHIDIFRAEEYTGVVTESDEMRPKWFDTTDIPFDQMWDEDRYWLPLLLSKQSFSGRADFEREGEKYIPKKMVDWDRFKNVNG